MIKLNKFTEIKKNIAMTEKKAEDVKTIFDSIRNVAICAALTLALPGVINFLESRFNFHSFAVNLFILFSVSFIFILYIYNIRWLAFKTKDVAEKVTQDETEDVTQNETEDVTQNETEDVTQNETEEVTQNETEEVTQNETEEVTQNETEKESANETKDKTSNSIKSKASFFISNMLFIILITTLTAGVTILELVDTVLLKRF